VYYGPTLLETITSTELLWMSLKLCSCTDLRLLLLQEAVVVLLQGLLLRRLRCPPEAWRLGHPRQLLRLLRALCLRLSGLQGGKHASSWQELSLIHARPKVVLAVGILEELTAMALRLHRWGHHRSIDALTLGLKWSYRQAGFPCLHLGHSLSLLPGSSSLRLVPVGLLRASLDVNQVWLGTRGLDRLQ